MSGNESTATISSKLGVQACADCGKRRKTFLVDIYHPDTGKSFNILCRRCYEDTVRSVDELNRLYAV